MCPSHDRGGASTRSTNAARSAIGCWSQRPSDDADQPAASKRAAAADPAIKRAAAAQRRFARKLHVAEHRP
jgi:hypothetical protein